MIGSKVFMTGVEVDKKGARKSSNVAVPAFSKDSRMHQILTSGHKGTASPQEKKSHEANTDDKKHRE
jgi:hypothetical protein